MIFFSQPILAQDITLQLKNVTVKGTNNTIYNVTKKKVDASKVTSVNEAANSVNASAKVLAMADLSVGDNVDTSKGVTITLSIDPTTISSGYSVYVLHQYGNGKWEVVKPSSVSNGQVTVTLYSLSPVAVIRLRISRMAIRQTITPTVRRTIQIVITLPARHRAIATAVTAAIAITRVTIRVIIRTIRLTSIRM